MGIREKEYTSVKGKVWGEGSVETLVDPTLVGYWFKSAFGTENKTTVSGGVYAHAFTVAEVSLPVSMTLTFDKSVYREWYPYSVVKDMELDVTDGLATLKASIQSQVPATTTSGTNTIPTTPPTIFTFKDLKVQFGASLAAAQAAVATKVKHLAFKVNNNTEAIYRSGSLTPDSFASKDFECTGEYDLILESTTERDNYYNLTKQYAIFTFTGATIAGAYSESITITLYNFRVNDFAVETGIDNLFATKSSFVAEYSKSDGKTVDAVIQNAKSSVY